jgi:hypothetical protein
MIIIESARTIRSKSEADVQSRIRSDKQETQSGLLRRFCSSAEEDKGREPTGRPPGTMVLKMQPCGGCCVRLFLKNEFKIEAYIHFQNRSIYMVAVAAVVGGWLFI